MRVAKWGVNRMLLIGRAWKANVNVWKRHLTLQSIFNRGECMMHVDKNVDGHVVDQNVDWISRKIAYVPLCGRIRSKRSSCMQYFFFFFEKKWVQDMLTSSLMDLKFWTCFPEVCGFEIWTYFQEIRWIWNLDVLPRGLMVWFWTCFLEVHWNWILDVLPRGPMVWSLDMFPKDPMYWSLDVLPRGPLKLNFGRVF